MTTVFLNNPAAASSLSVISTSSSTLAGLKRSSTTNTAPQFATNSTEDFTVISAKRTYWPTDIASPKTPESGIDMSTELGYSPPCYSVTRTQELTNTMNVDPPVNYHADQYKDGFVLRIADEPEENYRARYDSEGCRGPMKGRNGGCPTVELISTKQHYYWVNADVKVELVAVDRSPLNSCKLDSADEGANLFKKVHPGDTRVSFENLRIRRLKKGDTATLKGSTTTVKQQSKQHPMKGTRSKQDEKVAYLLFTAHVHVEYGTDIELKVLSQPIHLNASHDPPEIHCIVPQYASEGDSVAIIGTRMHSPRVTFLYNVDGKDHEVMADINKEFSHQNALVIKVPNISSNAFNSNIASIRIFVTAGKGDRTGKEPLKSNPMPFYCVYNGVCKECVMTTARQTQFLYSQSPQQQQLSTQPPPPPPLRSPSRHQLPTRLESKPIPRQATKTLSPRPHPPPQPKSSPGYLSPPPRTPLPSTSSFSTYSNTGPTMPPASVPPSTQQLVKTPSSSDVVDDLLSFCQAGGNNSIDHCPPITPPQPSPHYNVIHSIDSIGGFADNHSGPVSPDEFNCYLPNGNTQPVSGSFGSVTTSCCPQSQDFASVFSSASIVQPSSMGHFTQTS